MKIYDIRYDDEGNIIGTSGTNGSISISSGGDGGGDVDFSSIVVPVVNITGTDSTDLNSDNYVNLNSGMDVNINSVNDTYLFAQNDVSISSVNNIKLIANGGNIELTEHSGGNINLDTEGGGNIILSSNEGEIFISSTGASDGNVTIEATTNLIVNSDGMVINAVNGVTYGDDYSSSYTDRSLVDKAYVDSVSGGTGGGGSVTAGNGLTMNDSIVELGGTLDRYTPIDTNGNTVRFENTGDFSIGYGFEISSETTILSEPSPSGNYKIELDGYNGFVNLKASSISSNIVKINTDYLTDDRSIQFPDSDGTLATIDYVDSVAGGSIIEGDGIDITDGTVSLDISAYTTNGSISLSAYVGAIAITSDTLSLGGNNTSLNSSQSSLTMNGSYTAFGSSASNRSIQYSDDYSADFLDRSLVDKAYVDSKVYVSVLIQHDDTSRSAVENVGQMIFNTTVLKAQCYDGSTWNDLW